MEISCGDRTPTTTAQTAGWRSGNASAAVTMRTAWRSHTAAMRRARSTMSGGAGRYQYVAPGRGSASTPLLNGAGGVDRDAALPARGQQLGGGGLVEQGVAARDQHAVGLRFADEAHGRRGIVDARAHGADGALRAELGECGHGLADRLIQMVLRVVDVDELDPVEAEPDEALVDRTADALAAVIADAPESGGLREDVGAGRFAGCAGDEQPADLRAEDELRPGTVAQCRPEPLLGQPGAVVRSRVERAHAEIPGRVDGRAAPCCWAAAARTAHPAARSPSRAG